jgi:hypothetical protein
MAQNRVDKTLETVIGYTLRIGVIAAAVPVLAGRCYLIENAHTRPLTTPSTRRRSTL